jgi:Dyp-type peroxidase family
MTIDLDTHLDDTTLSSPEKTFMKNLQANILNGHGREHVALLFLAVKDVPAARKFLHAYPVTDSLTQYKESRDFKNTRTPGGVIRLVYLTKVGLTAFGHGTKFDAFQAFSTGMAADSAVLDNGTTDSWQPGLLKKAHVLLLVAYHDELSLARIAGKMVEDFDEATSPFEVVFVQTGRAYKNGDGEGIEHFGYVDGRSQPLMIQSAIDKEKKGAGGSFKHYDPTASLKQFVLKDPLDSDALGSFFVFRKLEQNVAEFKQAEKELGKKLGLIEKDAERAGAMVVGRFEDGTPVTLQDRERGVPVVNDFDYTADSDGSKCPFQGHIRKTNPRGSSPGGLAFDKSVQMARRGITYGERLQDPDSKAMIDQPNDGVGLLFMSYQASIEQQFQFMQTQWANSDGFPKAGVGIDPVIGQDTTVDQTWFPTWGSTADAKTSLFRGFVTLKGGDYFYTPSVSGIKRL